MPEPNPQPRPTETATLNQTVNRLTSHFAYTHRGVAHRHIAALLRVSPGSITEANILLVAAASTKWSNDQVAQCLFAIPTVGKVGRVESLDAPWSRNSGLRTMKQLRESFMATIDGFSPQDQANFVTSLIQQATYEAIRHIPDARQSIGSRAYRLLIENAATLQDTDLKGAIALASALSPTTTATKLIGLVEHERIDVVAAAAASPTFEEEDIKHLLDERPELQPFLIKNPNAPTSLVNEHITALDHEWAAHANASDFRLREIVEEMIAKARPGEELAEFLKNQNISPDTLTFAEQRIAGTPQGEKCLPVIYSHSNFSAEKATERVWRYIDAPAEMETYGYTPDRFALRCAGHPELSPDLQDNLLALNLKSGFDDALTFIAPTDRILKNLPRQFIEHLASNFKSGLIPAFERLAELELLHELDWRLLSMGTPEGAAWATSHPLVPRTVAVEHPAIKLVGHQAAICRAFPEARTQSPENASWATLTKPDFEPFDLPHALHAQPEHEIDGFVLRVMRNRHDFEQLEPRARGLALSYRYENDIAVVASKDGEPVAYGVFRRNGLEFEKHTAWRIIDDELGRHLNLFMPDEIEGAFTKLTQAWQVDQIAHIRGEGPQPLLDL